MHANHKNKAEVAVIASELAGQSRIIASKGVQAIPPASPFLEYLEEAACATHQAVDVVGASLPLAVSLDASSVSSAPSSKALNGLLADASLADAVDGEVGTSATCSFAVAEAVVEVERPEAAEAAAALLAAAAAANEKPSFLNAFAGSILAALLLEAVVVDVGEVGSLTGSTAEGRSYEREEAAAAC